MARLRSGILLLGIILMLIPPHESTLPFFLQAMTSALTTIPFTAGPMTSGLVGAKLAIGAKLLYYLGYFGRRSIPKPAPKPKGSPFPSGLNMLPLPYAMAGAGGFQQFGGFAGQNLGPGLFGGFDPAQLFQILASQGINPVTAMQIINSQGGGAGASTANFPIPSGGANQGPSAVTGGGDFSSMFPGVSGGGFGNMPAGFGDNGGFGNIPTGGFGNVPGGAGDSFGDNGGFGNIPTGGFGNVPGGAGDSFGTVPTSGQFENMPHDASNVLPPNLDAGQQGGGSESDIESFFTFLRDMDDNTCISRLVCDIGADPSFLGEFSENIHGIISTLDVMPSSGASQYIAIMETGKREGGCASRFPQCSDTAYEIVKNVAPTVGIPDSINSATVNKV